MLLIFLFFITIFIDNIVGQCTQDGCGYDPQRICQCNSACEIYNDCCPDYYDICGPSLFEECPNAPSNPQDRRQDITKLKIIAYNVEWLFLDNRHSIGTGVTCPGQCPWQTYDDALIHLQAIAGYLSSFDPDIVILTEVCDCWTLNELIDRMSNSQLYRPYLIKGEDTFTGQQVGIITKIDPVSNVIRTENRYAYPVNPQSQCNEGSGTQGVSKHMKTTFNIIGFDKPIDIIGIHLLSRPTDPGNCAKREAQAMVLSDLIKDSINQDHYIIIAGMFNITTFIFMLFYFT